ncbi:MAG: hypothetical protein ACOYEV_09220 [Candidatus Nanopelagicales bacterium]
MELALRKFLGFDLLERIWAQTDGMTASDDEAMEIAYEELRAARAERP